MTREAEVSYRTQHIKGFSNDEFDLQLLLPNALVKLPNTLFVYLRAFLLLSVPRNTFLLGERCSFKQASRKWHEILPPQSLLWVMTVLQLQPILAFESTNRQCLFGNHMNCV
jgi:hypothetical protein